MSIHFASDIKEYVLFYTDETGIDREKVIEAVTDNQAVVLAQGAVCGGEGLLGSFILTDPDGTEIPFEPLQ